jgi:hypothetical protein
METCPLALFGGLEKLVSANDKTREIELNSAGHLAVHLNFGTCKILYVVPESLSGVWCLLFLAPMLSQSAPRLILPQ